MLAIETNFHELIRNKEWRALKRSLNELDASEIGQLLGDAQDRDMIILFRLLTRKKAKEVFKLLAQYDQEEIIEALSEKSQKLANLLNDIEPDDRTTFFEQLPDKISQRLIQLLSPKERDITNQLLSYPKDSIGRLMTPEYIAIKSDFSIESAFAHIRKYGTDSETLDIIYIVDNKGKLIDTIRIKELILADPNQQVQNLMDHRFVALHAMDDQETAVEQFKKYDQVALPVVSGEGILLGIVTFDDILDVVDEESTEDFQKFGSFQNVITDPINARVFDLYKNRVVWLVVLVFMNIFSGAAMSNFEEVIKQVVPLVFFLPLLIDSGGNAGSQSATLMIRYLAVGGVKLSDWHRLVGKEFIVSSLLGITMAVGVAAVASFRAPQLMAVVAMSMILTVVIGSLIGLLLPFIFTKLRLDPATASAPLVTSLSDICGVIIYFSIANWFFGA